MVPRHSFLFTVSPDDVNTTISFPQDPENNRNITLVNVTDANYSTKLFVSKSPVNVSGSSTLSTDADLATRTSASPENVSNSFF